MSIPDPLDREIRPSQLSQTPKRKHSLRMPRPLIHNDKIWTRFQIWCISFVFTTAAVLISIAYLDRPIALLAEAKFGQLSLARIFVGTPGFFYALELLALGVVIARFLTRCRFGKPDVASLLIGASLIVADVVKSGLKYVFGRTWPKYAHPSFVHDGAYGFNPLHGGYVYQSFPSGHMAAICALVSVLWMLYPRFRPLYALLTVAAAIGLVAMNYHFLADLIAGGFLGVSTSVLVLSGWELSYGSAISCPSAGRPATVMGEARRERR